VSRRRVFPGDRRVTHGASYGPEYGAWKGIKRRCFNPKARNYRDYGGRGITMCQRWRDSFAAFFADVGPRPSADHSVERVNNDGHYEPDNVRWATQAEQSRNRRNNRFVEALGERLTVTDWCARLGVCDKTLLNRIKRFGAERAVLLPKPATQWSNAPRGEQQYAAKLTADAVIAIRKDSADGVPDSVLARRHGVTQGCICRVVKRQTWKHVP
jgi:hypothetical protein